MGVWYSTAGQRGLSHRSAQHNSSTKEGMFDSVCADPAGSQVYMPIIHSAVPHERILGVCCRCVLLALPLSPHLNMLLIPQHPHLHHAAVRRLRADGLGVQGVAAAQAAIRRRRCRCCCCCCSNAAAAAAAASQGHMPPWHSPSCGCPWRRIVHALQAGSRASPTLVQEMSSPGLVATTHARAYGMLGPGGVCTPC